MNIMMLLRVSIRVVALTILASALTPDMGAVLAQAPGAGGGSAGGSATAATTEKLTPQQARGRTVYDIKCLPCHGPGLWGTNALARRMPPEKAELTRRTDLNAVMVKTLMRACIGSMPPIRQTEVTDVDADAIAAYLTRNSTP